MSGRRLAEGDIDGRDGSWRWAVVRWDAGREHEQDEVTILLDPPDDPEHPLYGEKCLEFPLLALSDLLFEAESAAGWHA